MTIKVGINGFGRIGRLVLRAGFDRSDIEFIHINDPGGSAETLAHLLEFDSTHGRWAHTVASENDSLIIEQQTISCSGNRTIEETDWSGCNIVVEASGRMRKTKLLQAYLDQGVKHVVVSAPVKEDGVLNIVLGVNDHLFDPNTHKIVTAASCTTNCLAPVVKVINDNLGIEHGSMTTIHAMTNTQRILDTPQKDLRRARAAGTSLIPTTTGSAAAIIKIFPELDGKLNGHAVRVPIANPSLTDCVFEVKQPTSIEHVNAILEQASESALKNILGYEERPLVSVDYISDPRSSIIDALSTLVINKTQVKLYAWYDNEWGYANRTIELAALVGEKAVGEKAV